MIGSRRTRMVLGLAAGLASGCGFASADLESSRVERRSLEDVFLLTGELRALQSMEISTPRIEQGQPQIQWLAEDGTEVKEGDLLVAFDNSSTVAGIEEKRTALTVAEIQRESRERELGAERETRAAALDKAEVEARKAEVDAAVPPEMRSPLDYRRMQATFLEKKAAVQKARAELDAFDVSSRADLAELRSTEEKARRGLAASERILSGVSVRAERSGIFVVANHWRREEERKFQAGDNVWSGMTVASLPDLSRMEVEARLSEVDMGRVAVGNEARVYLDTWPERAFKGRVEEVGSVAAEGGERSGFKVRVSLDATDPQVMRPGLSTRVEVVSRKWENVLVVPRVAVRFTDGKPEVARPGSPDPAAVTLAGCTATDCIVESGLSEGDAVHAF